MSVLKYLHTKHFLKTYVLWAEMGMHYLKSMSVKFRMADLKEASENRQKLAFIGVMLHEMCLDLWG